ncbi:hypothetical protein [Streptomyces sp. ISL-100]|uniref:hypothetical protein n=1 Tax=Streptomyces sp. ISL-100 TaxID=2819173 RepID=UPI001BEA600A|nr:hypothetical protein [Streptomyces sp. ISL-100]MBT2398707.1 hypothetical protein [Streptomyces sp. ISL-100]
MRKLRMRGKGKSRASFRGSSGAEVAAVGRRSGSEYRAGGEVFGLGDTDRKLRRMWIAPSSVPGGMIRLAMFGGGILACGSGIWLMVTGPETRFTVLGGVFVLMGAFLFKVWWSER